MLNFANPALLTLLSIVPLLIWWYFKFGQKREATVQFSSVSLLKMAPKLSGYKKIKFLMILRFVIIGLLIVALARPRSLKGLKETSVDVIDMMLVLDISSSMLAQDFQPNRLESAKMTAKKFIQDRKGDRMGLLVFAGETYIQCPLTIDYGILNELLSQISVIDKEHDGTAMGMALAHAVNRLRKSEAKNKIIILLSDGSNNAGELDPITSAEFARDLKIKIYAVGVGRKGKAPYPVNDPFGSKRIVQVEVDMDEETLRRVAEITSGTYFLAADEEQLAGIYQEIDRLERSEVRVKEFREFEELFGWFLIPAVILFLGEEFLADLVFRRRT